jgi:hypothetical protein
MDSPEPELSGFGDFFSLLEEKRGLIRKGNL